jgi:hypothetical protein
MTRDELLAITRPEDLYPGDLDAAKGKFRDLATVWHPDKPGGDGVVFAHVAALHRAAEAKIVTGRWEAPGVVTLTTLDGVSRPLAVLVGAPFPLGHSLVTEDAVWYLVDPDHRAFLDRFVRATTHWRFGSAAMRDEVERYLPTGLRTYALEDGRYALMVPKSPDLIRLRDVVTHLGPLDGRHLAWIVSSLMNICSYLDYTKLVHHDISPDTCFISPKYHSVALLGGWWYAATVGAAVDVLPRRTINVMPFDARMNKIAATGTDLELVRLTARECLASGAPAPMALWLANVGVGSARSQYADWSSTLIASYGQRKFTPLLLTAREVYRVRRAERT